MPRNKSTLFRILARNGAPWMFKRIKLPGPNPADRRFNTVYPDSMRCLLASLRCGPGWPRCPHHSGLNTGTVWRRPKELTSNSYCYDCFVLAASFIRAPTILTHMGSITPLWERNAAKKFSQPEQVCRLKIKVLYYLIFIFNKHFDKENDCVLEPLKAMHHHWRRHLKTLYTVNILLFKNKNLT